jgi:hypothetical protein
MALSVVLAVIRHLRGYVVLPTENLCSRPRLLNVHVIRSIGRREHCYEKTPKNTRDYSDLYAGRVGRN